MPVILLNALHALCKVCSGELSNGFPSLLKKEQSMESVGISAKGSKKAVRNRGITYRSLLPASMNGNRLEPSTRSPQVRIASRYAWLLITKFNVFSRPSPAGYIKLTIRMPFCWMYRFMSSLVNSAQGFSRNATNWLGFIINSLFIAKLVVFCLLLG